MTIKLLAKLTSNVLFTILLSHSVAALAQDNATPTSSPSSSSTMNSMALEAPVLSYLISNTWLDLNWTSVPSALSYTLFYAPYPAATPIYELDMDQALRASGELAVDDAFYFAIQANFPENQTALSNIENFRVTGIDIIEITDPVSDISSIVYGPNGTSLVTLNSSSTTTMAVLNFKGGKQAVMTGDSSGQLTRLSVEGFTATIDYGGGSMLTTITAPDGSVSTVAASAFVQAVQSLPCGKGSKCQNSSGAISNLEGDVVSRFEKLVDDGLATFRKIPTVLFCAQPIGIPTCAAIEYFAENGNQLKERLSNRVQHNINRIDNALTCTVSTENCSQIAAEYAPTVVQQLDKIGTSLLRPSAGFDVGAEKVTPKESWRDYFGDGSFTLTEVPCSESVFAYLRPECGEYVPEIDTPSTQSTPGVVSLPSVPSNPDIPGFDSVTAKCRNDSQVEECFNAAGFPVGVHKRYVLTSSNTRYLTSRVEYNGYTKNVTYFYENGRVSNEFSETWMQLLDGSDPSWVSNGESRSYFDNGILYGIVNERNGIFHGTQKTFNLDGTPLSVGNYKNGVLDGDQDIYIDGKLNMRVVYSNGEIIDYKFF